MVVWQWHQDKHLLVWSKRKSSNLIFAPRTRFLFIFCSTQRCENRNKMNFASKQRKSLQKSIHCKFVTCRKVCYKEQFVIDLQSQNYSTQQTILSCGARLLHMNFFAPRTNMMYDPGELSSWAMQTMYYAVSTMVQKYLCLPTIIDKYSCLPTIIDKYP